MTIVRRFLLAQPLSRLIGLQRGAVRIIEAFFDSKPQRSSYVHVEGESAVLSIVTMSPDGLIEERTDLPRTHAEALAEVCPTKVMFDRTRLAVADGHEVLIDQYLAPQRFSIAAVEFETPEAAKSFTPPPWVEQEITGEARFDFRALAVDGLPDMEEPLLGAAKLNALIDILERNASAAPRPRAKGSKTVLDTLFAKLPTPKSGEKGGEAAAEEPAAKPLLAAAKPAASAEGAAVVEMYGGDRKRRPD